MSDSDVLRRVSFLVEVKNVEKKIVERDEIALVAASQTAELQCLATFISNASNKSKNTCCKAS